MITIKIEGSETIAIESEIGTIHLTQQIVNVGERGHDFRTVLDIHIPGTVSNEDYGDIIRLSKVRKK